MVSDDTKRVLCPRYLDVLWFRGYDLKQYLATLKAEGA